MENILKEFLDGLIDAEKSWQSADHLILVTYKVVKDDKLLLRALENIYESVVKTISVALRFEYFYKRIELSKDSKRNLEIFFVKLGRKYGLSKEDERILREIIFSGKKHKESGLEFSGKGKAVILDDKLGKYELDLDKVKEFIKISKKLLENANRNFKEIF
jgi:hypothetical protein